MSARSVGGLQAILEVSPLYCTWLTVSAALNVNEIHYKLTVLQVSVEYSMLEATG
jgi:hypothetical protein